MSLSSIKLNGLEVIQSPYYVLQEGLSALMATPNVEPRLAEMAGRHPHLTGWTETERAMPLTVGFTATTTSGRETLYFALLAAIAPRYIPIEWTVNGTTYHLNVLCSQAVPDSWYKQAALALIAPNPTPTT